MQKLKKFTTLELCEFRSRDQFFISFSASRDRSAQPSRLHGRAWQGFDWDLPDTVDNLTDKGQLKGAILAVSARHSSSESWTAGELKPRRGTSVIEDRAYRIFDVLRISTYIRCGEGEAAFLWL